MTPTKDLTGKRFGNLTVINRSDRMVSTGNVVWKCLCDCGNYTNVPSNNLITLHTKSCGCGQFKTTHGLTGTSEYNIYRNRKRRELRNQLDNGWTIWHEVHLREYMKECVLCGISDDEHYAKYQHRLHVDHIKPLSQGYGLAVDNAVMLCRMCNLKKGNKSFAKLSKKIQNKLLVASESFQQYIKLQEA